MPSSTTRRRTRSASSGSSGEPQMPRPVIRIAPKPRRWTSRSPPMVNVSIRLTLEGEHRGSVADRRLVLADQLTLDAADLRHAERVEARAAQAAHPVQRSEGRHEPATELQLPLQAERAQERRGQEEKKNCLLPPP